MIYTITFNPSLDYVVTLPHLQVGAINRNQAEEIFPGGKGINVSWVLQNLGVPTRILGFKAGFTGDEIQRLVEERGIPCSLLAVEKGFSRINVKIRAEEETALNGKGPEVTTADLDRLRDQLRNLTADDILVLSGSGPAAALLLSMETLLEKWPGGRSPVWWMPPGNCWQAPWGPGLS